jgi:hypothetical protein
VERHEFGVQFLSELGHPWTQLTGQFFPTIVGNPATAILWFSAQPLDDIPEPTASYESLKASWADVSHAAAAHMLFGTRHADQLAAGVAVSSLVDGIANRSLTAAFLRLGRRSAAIR